MRILSVWLIVLAVALVATIQIRSELEVQRSLAGTDATSLAFLIDDLHRANDSLQSEKTDLMARRAQLRSGQTGAADAVLIDEAKRLRAVEGLTAVRGPGIVMEIDASGLTVLDLQDALNNLAAGGGRGDGRQRPPRRHGCRGHAVGWSSGDRRRPRSATVDDLGDR